MVAKDGVGTTSKSGSGGSATMSAYIAAVAQDRSWRISSALSWPAPMASNDGNAKPINPPAAGMIVAVNPTSPASKRSARCWAFLILPRAAVTLSAASLTENAMHARPTPVRICSARVLPLAHLRERGLARAVEAAGDGELDADRGRRALGVLGQDPPRAGDQARPLDGLDDAADPDDVVGGSPGGSVAAAVGGASTVASTMQTRPPLMSEVT